MPQFEGKFLAGLGSPNTRASGFGCRIIIWLPLPPPPPPICQNIWNQRLAGFERRNSLQNLHNKELESQNLESMRLTVDS